MTFTHPEFLWGLLALSIPIFYHLFQLRRFVKVYYSDVRFLAQVQDKSARKKKIEHWVTLLLRLLALTFIILAFANPQWGELQDEDTPIVIAMDLSPSMNVSELETPLYLRALADARTVVQSFPLDANFRVLGHPNSPYASETLTQQDVLALLNKTEGATYDIKLAAPKTLRSPYTLFVFSDFQQTEDWNDLFSDSLQQKAYLFSYAPGDSTPNTYIDSAWFDSPESHLGTRQTLKVRVKKQPFTTGDSSPLEIVINGTQQSVATAEFGATGISEVSFDIYHKEPGWNSGKVLVADPLYPLDNELFFSYSVKNAYTVLHLYANQPFDKMQKAFIGDEMTYQSLPLNAVPTEAISKADLIAIEDAQSLSSGMIREIEEAVSGGAHVLLMESSTGKSPRSLSKAFQGPGTFVYKNIEPSLINHEDAFYSGVFSIPPERTSGFTIPQSKTIQPPFDNCYPLYQDALGNAWAARWSLGEGVVTWLGNTPSELTRGQLNSDWFPVFFSRSLLYSERKSPLYLSSNSSTGFPLENPNTRGESPVQLFNQQGNSWIPLQRPQGKNTQIFLPPNWDQSGIYMAVVEKDTLGIVGVNHESGESNLSYWSPGDLGFSHLSWIDGDQKAEGFAKESAWNSSIWKYCLIFALLFTVAEGVYTRLNK